MNYKIAMVVDNAAEWREFYTGMLKAEGYQVDTFSSEKGALEFLGRCSPSVAIVHFKESPVRSLRFIEKCARRDDAVSLIYPTFYSDPDLPMRALGSGAFAVVSKLKITDRAEFSGLLERAFNQSIARRQHRRGGPNIFVLMPFAARFDERYTLGIKEPLEALGIRCERGDELRFTGNVVDKLGSCIREATLIVADMTGKNPNVFYEVGYAHALSKPVILLTERANDIPFDLANQRHIVYGRSVVRLREGLISTVREVLGSNLPALDSPSAR